MFRKYEKTFRAQVPGIEVSSRYHLPKEDLKHLLNGEVIVEEKMDGANIGIIRHKEGIHLQKRGSLVGTSEHEQFQFFHNWAQYQNRERLMELPIGTILYGELLYAVHSIYYDSLPDYVLFFDAWSKKKDGYLSYEQRAELCSGLGLFMVPLRGRGHFSVGDLPDLMPPASAHGPTAEGMVIKRYRKGECLRAKVVKPEFLKHMEESDHWMHQAIRRNKRV